MGWRVRWAKRHPLQWGVFNAIGVFVAIVVVVGLNHHLTPTAFFFALGFALIVLLLATASGYLMRHIKPN